MTSFEVWGLGVVGMVAMVLVSFVMAMLLMWGGSSALNGCAVFAHKHALALAHASRGGKCRLCGNVACKASRRPEEANTWSCTERFPSAVRRQGRRPSASLVTLPGPTARELLLVVAVACSSGCCGVSPLRR